MARTLYYACPPFSVIPAVLQKVREEQAEGIVIAPVWTTQAWFPRLMCLLANCMTTSSSHEAQVADPTTPRAQEALTNQDATGCLPGVGESLQKQGVSSTATKIIMYSWRHSIKRQYTKDIKRWLEFCSRRMCDPHTSPVGLALDFMAELFNIGLQYSAIKTSRSALSTLEFLPNGQPAGTHPLVIRLLKGVFQSRRMCVVTVLKEYLNKTKTSRKITQSYLLAL